MSKWNYEEARRNDTSEALEKAAKPLVEWLRTVFPHPHCMVFVDQDSVQCMLGHKGVPLSRGYFPNYDIQAPDESVLRDGEAMAAAVGSAGAAAAVSEARWAGAASDPVEWLGVTYFPHQQDDMQLRQYGRTDNTIGLYYRGVRAMMAYDLPMDRVMGRILSSVIPKHFYGADNDEASRNFKAVVDYLFDNGGVQPR